MPDLCRMVHVIPLLYVVVVLLSELDRLFSFVFHRKCNSVRELGLFTETANAVNRLLLSHLSISEAYDPPTPVHACSEDDTLDQTTESMDSGDVVFQLDMSSDDSVDSFISFRPRDKTPLQGDADVIEKLSSAGDMQFKSQLSGRPLRQQAFSVDISDSGVVIGHHRRMRTTQLSGDSGFISGDLLSPSSVSMMHTPPKSSS